MGRHAGINSPFHFDRHAVERGHPQTASNPHQDPLLDDFGQLIAAGLEGRAGGNHSSKTPHRRAEGRCIDLTVLRTPERTIEVADDHENDDSAGGMAALADRAECRTVAGGTVIVRPIVPSLPSLGQSGRDEFGDGLPGAFGVAANGGDQLRWESKRDGGVASRWSTRSPTSTSVTGQDLRADASTDLDGFIAVDDSLAHRTPYLFSSIRRR